MTYDTFASKGWKPLSLESNDRVAKVSTYKDNGGVCYAGHVASRTGQTHASGDIITIQATTDVPVGIPVQVYHADRTDWDFDEIAADNDVVHVAELGSGHVVCAFILSTQTDMEAGTILVPDCAGRLRSPAVAAAAGDSISIAQTNLAFLVGRLYEDSPQSAADPKTERLAKVILNI